MDVAPYTIYLHINAYSMQMERLKRVHMAPPSRHACMLNEALACGTKVHKEISCAVNYNYIHNILSHLPIVSVRDDSNTPCTHSLVFYRPSMEMPPIISNLHDH